MSSNSCMLINKGVADCSNVVCSNDKCFSNEAYGQCGKIPCMKRPKLRPAGFVSWPQIKLTDFFVRNL